MLQVIRSQRKPFEVDAVQVTEENIFEVAVWCEGFVVGIKEKDLPYNPYIQVKVHKPQSPRQTTAFVGDWVLKTKTGNRVYTDKAYKESFEEKKDICGNTELTMDGNPCVFARAHRLGANPTGCRSADDYLIIGRIPPNFQKHMEKNPVIR